MTINLNLTCIENIQTKKKSNRKKKNYNKTKQKLYRIKSYILFLYLLNFIYISEIYERKYIFYILFYFHMSINNIRFHSNKLLK